MLAWYLAQPATQMDRTRFAIENVFAKTVRSESGKQARGPGVSRQGLLNSPLESKDLRLMDDHGGI